MSTSRTLTFKVLGVVMLAALALSVLSISVMAAPLPYSTSVTLADINGLGGDASDFWSVDYFDTDGPGVGGDPTATIATPPTLLPGYGSTALRLDSGTGTGGSGCARLGGKPFFGTTQLEGVRLSELTSLGYSYLVDSNSGVPAADPLTPYINIFVDRDGDGIWRGATDSILIYEPLYTLGNPTLDTVWYDNLPIGVGETGRWHYAAQSLPGMGQFTPNTVDLWTEIMAQPVGGAGFDPSATTIGDLRVVNPDPGCSAGDSQEGTGSGLVITVGQKSGTPWDQYVAFIDGVYLTVGGASPVSFTANVNAVGDPVTATILSGGSQTTPVNSSFAPLVVELRDAAGALADIGAQATVSVPGAGASAVFVNTTATVTDASGTVTFYPTANATEGSYSVDVAAVAPGTATVSTTFTNGAAASLTPVKVFAEDVEGLAGTVGDFWRVDYYDTNPSTDNPAGSITRTTNAAPGAGYASFQFYVGAETGTIGGNPAGCQGAGGKTLIGTQALVGMTLRDLDQLGYSAMLSAIGAEDASPNLLPYVNIFFDMNNDGQWLPADDGILVFNGSLGAPYVLGEWEDTGDLAAPDSTRLWNFAVRSPLPGNYGLNSGVLNYRNMMNQTVRPDVEGGLTVGDLRVVNPVAGCNGTTATEGTGSGFAFVFGQKNGNSYNNMVAHIDNIRLATSGGAGGQLDIAAVYDITDYDTAANITVVVGTPQNAAVNTAFGLPLAVAVTDAQGRTVPNESVTFTAPGSGASAVFTSANPDLTDLISGLADVTVSANGVVGSYNVTANITPALATPATFALSNGAVAPAAPTDLSATYVAPTTVNLAWTSTASADLGDQQDVQRKLSADSTWTTLATLGAAANSYADTVGCGASYDYRIRVFNTADEALSNVATVVVPNCPTTISVSAGDGQSALVNTAYAANLVALVSNNDGSPAAGVTVNFVAPATGPSVTFSSGSTAVTDASGLASVSVTANAEAGTVVVVAISPEVAESAAAFTLTNLPAAPSVAVTDLAVTTVSQTALNLSWTDVAATSFDSYEVYRTSDGTTFTLVATLPGGSTSYADSGLVCGVAYTYRVDVVNVTGTLAGTPATSTTTACDELLTNGNFNADAGNTEQLVPTGWRGRRLTNDRQRCALTDTKSFDGVCYLRFRVAPGENARFVQVVDPSTFVAGETLTLSASAWARGGSRGRVLLEVTYPNPLRNGAPFVSVYPLAWDTNEGAYTTQTLTHTLVTTPLNVRVIIRSRGTTGQLFVDGVSLTRTNVGVLRMPGSEE